MEGSNSGGTEFANGRNNEEGVLEMRPGGMLVQKRDDGVGDHSEAVACGPSMKIKVSYGSKQFEFTVPAQSTFGDLKMLVASETGLIPQQQRLLFRGKEKEDKEYLQTAGVKDNARLLLMEEQPTRERNAEDTENTEILKTSTAVADAGIAVDELVQKMAGLGASSKDRKLEETESPESSRAFAAVVEVRSEVDKLAEQVAALETAVLSGTKVEAKKFVVLTELLMRQLLKLDGIEAEGGRKVQRKVEVSRVQSLVDKLDALKEKNSNPFSSNSMAVSLTTNWETFECGMGSLNPPPSLPSSTKVTQDWELFD